ncbi:MAG TPA: M23 family metallopeptidase [Candidatus Dormibacteraeota bacterium]|nr:M23 family metallopeptidase [Candidatus Dormibacteraeota bacterium]
MTASRPRIITRARLVALLALGVALSPAAAAARGEERITPLLLAVHDPPIPFRGSDGRTHLVYELWITNFSSGEATVAQVDVLGDGKSLATLDAAAVATRLQPAGRRDASDTLPSGGTSLLFIHLTLPEGATAPTRLSHAVRARVAAAPPGQRQMTISGGDVTVDRRPVVVIGPPLRGDRYIAADSCCDASRHTRAALPVDGRVRIAQRYAVDWEQVDDANRIYVGPREQVSSYAIFGTEALAAADARVAAVVDGLPEQTPGKFPEAITLAEADGNSVVLDLGHGRFALYAHLQPGSLRVHPGDRVTRGQVIGLVGNSGNSVAPHLHFHVMDGASALDSNGLPYEIDAFEVVGHTPGTAAFDVAEEQGTALAITAVLPPQRATQALPLDQSIVRFGP